MTESVRIPVVDPSQTAEARRVAAKITRDLGFDEALSHRVGIVVTEVCSNLLHHGGGGEVLLTLADRGQATAGLELLALDRGRGMANLKQCMEDGFSSRNSAGQGLGAIMRLSGTSDFFSIPEKGTAVLARWDASGKAQTAAYSGSVVIGALNVSKPGELVCGDSWTAVQIETDTVIMVADGLGHGIEANAASKEAVRMVHAYPKLPPKALTERIHEALRSSRGAAVAVARLDLQRRTVTFAGVGNISAQIYRGPKASQHLVSANGTAGHQIQSLREFTYPWPEDALVVLHSDGLSTGTNIDNHFGLAVRDPSLIAGVLYRDYSRGRDDATVVIAKAA